MLDKIWQVIKSIGEFFTSVGNFIADFFSDLVYFIELIGKTIADIPSYLGWLPTSIVTLLLAIFSIVIICRVLGRD